MLKIRLMGTRNDIKWFEKILKRQPKVVVTEFSELYRNKGTNRFYRACFTEPDKLEVTPANVLEKVINDEEMEPGYDILKHGEGIDLMPGNIELSGLEVSLVNVMSRELVLRSYIEQVWDRYSYILIDCMPSLGMITINAFACADSMLIPVQAAYLPVKNTLISQGLIPRSSAA